MMASIEAGEAISKANDGIQEYNERIVHGFRMKGLH